jgi:tRNA pseudouridine55 synthase
VGKATRLIQYVQQLPKSYRAEFLLGRQSDTDDIEGQVTLLADASIPSLHQIEDTLPNYLGTIQQRPPAFSALKVAGQPAYKLARQGQPVDLAARPVEIIELKVLSYEYPKLAMAIRCGSGTYVRSLGRDIAKSLGTAAVMSGLQRTGIGDFRIEDACGPLDLDAANLQTRLQGLEVAVKHLPALQLTDEETRKVRHGVRLDRPRHGLEGAVRAMDTTGCLLAVLVPHDADTLRVETNLVAEG